jgi:hypothetical protein
LCAAQSKRTYSQRNVIAYLVTGTHSYTMTWYLRTWGIGLARRIKVLEYEHLPPVQEVKATTWIFSDLDRLSAEEIDDVSDLWARLSRADPPVQLLNDPRRVLGRYELLRRLHDRGINTFRPYRLSELPRTPRFPVFLREEGQHVGALSGLVTTSEALDQVVSIALAEGYQEDALLIVEFCDTSDETGTYRKFGAFCVGGRIVPRHLIVSRDWQVKVELDRVDSRKLEEERSFLTENPHAATLRNCFRLANIDYGRIDYSLHDGKPQVWEINTNPMPVSLPWEHKVRRVPNQWRFAKQFRSAFETLDRTAVPRH